MGSFLTLLIDLSFPTLGNLFKKFQTLSNPHPLPALPPPPHGVYIDRCIRPLICDKMSGLIPNWRNSLSKLQKLKTTLDTKSEIPLVILPNKQKPDAKKQKKNLQTATDTKTENPNAPSNSCQWPSLIQRGCVNFEHQSSF